MVNLDNFKITYDSGLYFVAIPGDEGQNFNILLSEEMTIREVHAKLNEALVIIAQNADSSNGGA